MANFNIHYNQAKHNEKAARTFVDTDNFHDWGLTAAYYSAIHYFECFLLSKPETHTEVSVQGDQSRHSWRLHLASKYLSSTTYVSLKELKVISETARYLTDPLFARSTGGGVRWIGKTACEFFTKEEAKRIIDDNLEIIKKEVNLGVVEGEED